jgi:DNA replication and repair protein RecF
VNLLWGENGAGKSNLLEAIYFLFTTCSFRTQRTVELVARGERSFRLVAKVETGTGSYRLGVEQDGPRRTLVLDDKKVGLEQVLERFSVLAFSSRQMEVLEGGPRERRRFLDRGILALKPGYLRELGEFRRTLAQRNKLLQTGAPPAERAAWDERFAEIAARVRVARRSYCGKLAAAVGEYAGELTPRSGAMRLIYRPSPADGAGRPVATAEADVAAVDGPGEAAGPGGNGEETDRNQARETILAALGARAAEERRMGHTLVGPHRDEVRFLVGEMDLGRFGSAGQRRAALLALKVARMEMYQEARGELPLLLVDDLDSDLDEEASQALLRRVSRSQVFVATCKHGSVRRFADQVEPFRVRDGNVEAAMPETEQGMAVPVNPEGETWNRAKRW